MEKVIQGKKGKVVVEEDESDDVDDVDDVDVTDDTIDGLLMMEATTAVGKVMEDMGREMAEMSAAVVSTGTDKMSSMA